MLMFRDLVTHLSLSPSISGQLAFYARRLRGEKLTRQLSAIFAAMLLGLTVLTTVAPPTPANAASGNDVIFGGVRSLNELMSIYDRGNGGRGQSAAEIQAIFNHFGVSRADITQTRSGTINSRDHSLLSIGRNRHLASDQKMIIGGQTYYLRALYTWDTGSRVQTGSTYQAFIGKRSRDGGYFAVMFNCGNIVIRNIPTPQPTPTPTPVPTPAPQSISCLGLTANPPTGTLPVTVTFTGRGQVANQTITGYDFDFGDNTTQASATPTVTHSYGAEGSYTAYVQIRGSSGTQTPKSSTCSAPVQVTAVPANVEYSKTATNSTQQVDATSTKANAGDVITYTLTTKNTGGTPFNDFVVTDHIIDILEYADITNLGGATLTEGTLTWPAETIAAGATLTKTFEATIKTPVPETPVSSSDPQSFDLCMDNVYGNAIRVCITPPPAKQIEAGTQSLPETGAETTILMVLAFAGLVIYFYLRNRQLMTEIKLLRHDYHGGGQ